MKPIGPLMREHRLIERMINLLSEDLKRTTEKGQADVELLMMGIDFMRTYADRTDHGKEEDILFRELSKKELSAGHLKIMNELVEEHAHARKMVAALAGACARSLLSKATIVPQLHISQLPEAWLLRQLVLRPP